MTGRWPAVVAWSSWCGHPGRPRGDIRNAHVGGLGRRRHGTRHDADQTDATTTPTLIVGGVEAGSIYDWVTAWIWTLALEPMIFVLTSSLIEVAHRSRDHNARSRSGGGLLRVRSRPHPAHASLWINQSGQRTGLPAERAVR
ncbi:MAG: hypothetical protein ACRDJ2_09905 [Actinomycetota bacterium]